MEGTKFNKQSPVLKSRYYVAEISQGGLAW